MVAFAGIDWRAIFEPSLGLGEVVVRGSLIYLALFLILRGIARRQTGNLGPADLVVIVLVADAAQNGFGKDYTSVTEAVVLVLTIVGWEYLIDWLAWRVPALAPLIKVPALKLIENGVPVEAGLRKEMITREDLKVLLRQQSVDDIEDVREAVLEADGHLSVKTFGKADGSCASV